MEDILTSDYAKQFIEKIDKHELFIEDLKMLHESGYLKDTELYFALNKYCRERNTSTLNQIWCAIESTDFGSSAVTHAMLDLLDDATIYKIWKQVSEEVYG